MASFPARTETVNSSFRTIVYQTALCWLNLLRIKVMQFAVGCGNRTGVSSKYCDGWSTVLHIRFQHLQKEVIEPNFVFDA